MKPIVEVDISMLPRNSTVMADLKDTGYLPVAVHKSGAIRSVTVTGRKCIAHEWQQNEATRLYEKVCIGSATFLAFGVDYQDLENGVGNYSTAIIEMPSGQVKNVPVELINFNLSGDGANG